MTGAPRFPRFVVTIMTPFAPFAPNTAVALASFNTDIDPTSLGSKSVKLRSTPSTSTKGCEPFQLDTPRITISELFAPGSPACCIVKTPDILPANALVTLEFPERINDSLPTWTTAPTTLSFFCVP